MNNYDQERAQFEAAINRDWPEDQSMLAYHGDGYISELVDKAWWAWQASARQSISVAMPHTGEDWSIFAGYLVDKCEGYEISEESIQGWLSEMLADPHYGALFRREKQPCEMPSAIELSIEAAEEEHGSLRAAAKALGIDPGYLSRLKNGGKKNPGDDVLSALGLVKFTSYRSSDTTAPHPVSGEQKPAAWLIDWPDEPKLGHYFSNEPNDGARSRPLYTAPPAAQEQKPDALRKRFSDIEDEIMAGKHNAESVFTAMRTAALYIGQPAAQDVSGLVEALEQIVKQYPNPDINHVDYRVHACRQAEAALAEYRAEQAPTPNVHT